MHADTGRQHLHSRWDSLPGGTRARKNCTTCQSHLQHESGRNCHSTGFAVCRCADSAGSAGGAGGAGGSAGGWAPHRPISDLRSGSEKSILALFHPPNVSSAAGEGWVSGVDDCRYRRRAPGGWLLLPAWHAVRLVAGPTSYHQTPLRFWAAQGRPAAAGRAFEDEPAIAAVAPASSRAPNVHAALH